MVRVTDRYSYGPLEQSILVRKLKHSFDVVRRLKEYLGHATFMGSKLVEKIY
jgi:hypothetical protein